MYKAIKNIIILIFINFMLLFGIIDLFCNDYAYINSFSNASSCSDFVNFDIVNPAIIYREDSLNINLAFSPYRYQMKELNPIAINLNIPISGQLKIYSDLSGIFNDLYSNYKLNISSAYSINKAFSFGAGLKYSSINIKDNGEFSEIDISIGSIIDLSRIFCIGLSAELGNNYDSTDFQIKQICLSGGIINIENFNFDLGFNIDIDKQTSMIFGAKYYINESIALRLAYKTQPNSIQAGIKIKLLKYLELYYLLDKNSNLGYSNSLIIGIEL